MASLLTARTVYLKLHPTARSFPERREVLRVLERFGEVTMFKSYKYNPRTPTPNTFIALFATDKAAQDLINASPIRYRLIANPSATPSTTSPITPSQDPSSPPEQTRQERDERIVAAETEAAGEERPFQLHAYPSTFSHTLFLSSPLHSPLRGPYKPITPRNSYIASSLSQIIPKSIYSAGLMDWETGSGRFSASGEESENLRVGVDGIGGSGRGEEGAMGRAEYYFEKREKRRALKGIPRAMEGLRGLRREAEKEMEQEKERGVDF